MKTIKYLLVSLLFSSLLLACSTTAQKNQVAQTNQPFTESYADKVGDKATRGFANMATGPLEVPKNMINLTNTEGGNLVYGVIGGAIKGSLDTAGRVGTGIADFFTAPLITKPIAQPQYIWDDFDTSTSYGDVFRLEKN